MDNREAIENLKGCVVSYEVDEHGNPNGNVTADLTMGIINMAISALEKQEQSNTQNINSTHTSRPNALESLNILEQAKDDKGNVPMSLVRQAFRNIQEQTKEAIPHRNYQYLSDYWCECGWHLGKKEDVKFCADCGRRIKWD